MLTTSSLWRVLVTAVAFTFRLIAPVASDIFHLWFSCISLNKCKILIQWVFYTQQEENLQVTMLIYINAVAHYSTNYVTQHVIQTVTKMNAEIKTLH